MQILPEHLFADPVLAALETTHAHLALRNGDAIRYQREVSPFAALRTPSTAALRELHDLLVPGERIWLAGIAGLDAASAGLKVLAELPCHQMILPDAVSFRGTDQVIRPLTCADAAEMVALTDIAFPGFFRLRTCQMGRYCGIRDATSDRLVAMAGERLTFPGYSEISGICTLPERRGQGLAAALIGDVVRHHRQAGTVSWLHVSAANERAISLYRLLGFEIVRTIPLTQLSRPI